MNAGVPAGAKCLSPGVYELGDELHIDARELCRANGVPYTERNVETLVAAAMAVAADEGIPEVEVREDE